MTIGTQINRIVCLGDGATTVFVYPFLIPNAADAVITLTNADGTQLQLSPPQYVIAGLGNPTGGTVTYPLSPSPLQVGQSLTIQRILPLVQITSIRNQGPTFAAIEDALDNEEMQIQQIQDEYGRTIQFNIADPYPHNTLPPLSQLAGQMLGFDSQGNPIAAQPSSALVSSAMQPIVASSSVNSAFTAMADTIATIAGTLDVTGPSNLADVNVAGDLGIASPTSTVTVGGTLDVVGTSNLGTVNVAGDLTAASPASTVTVGGTLDVAGPANLSTANVISGVIFGPSGSIGMVTGPGGTLPINCSLALGGNLSLPGGILASGVLPGSGSGASLQAGGVIPAGAWTAPLCFNGSNALAGTGFFTLSDERTKTDIRDITAEEAERWVRAARPRHFTNAYGQPDAGFVAQEDLAAGRELAVSKAKDSDPRFAQGEFAGFRLSRRSDPDVAYLTRLVVWLADRVAALERKS